MRKNTVILQDFGLSEGTYGIIASLMTIGMFIGPIFASGIIKKYHYSKLVSAIIMFDGLLCLLIALCTFTGLFPSITYNTVIIVALINILMITIIWVNLGITTARQRVVPGHLQGRVVAVVGTFSMAAMPVGQALMGLLLDKSESYVIIGVFAVLVILSGLLAKAGFSKLVKSGKMDLSLDGEKTTDEIASTVDAAAESA